LKEKQESALPPYRQGFTGVDDHYAIPT